MRVPTISVYNQATYQLNNLICNLNEANEVVGSENGRINTCSDDPAGMSKVLDIDSTISSLDQYQDNIAQGLTVLTNAETALDAMADQVRELKLLCSQLANASANTRDRADAAESMQVYLDSLMDLANTEAYGGYVFGGDQNQVPPFSYDDDDAPTCVNYLGSSDATCVKTGQDTVMTLDCCGSDLFYEDGIIVDESNNQLVFEEDPGTGEENILTIEATIPNGTYTREELSKIVEDTMTEASGEEGCGIVYEAGYDEEDNLFSIGTDGTDTEGITTTLVVQQDDEARISNLAVNGGEYDDIEIEIISPSALTEFTPEPEGTEPLTLTYNEDGNWTVKNDPGYGLVTEIEGDGDTLELDLDDDGVTDISIDLNDPPEEGVSISFDIVEGFENNSIMQDLGFDAETVSIAPVQSSSRVADEFTVMAGENDCLDFTETLSGEEGQTAQLTAVVEPGTYSDPESYAAAVEDALEQTSAESGNRINYEVAYNTDSQTFTIREDTDTGKKLESFDLLFQSGTNADTGAASDLGFAATDISSGAVTGDEVSWSIFDTLFDLEQALSENDVDGIQRAMTRFENHYSSIISSISGVGISYDGLTATAATASATELALTLQRSDVQDADSVSAIMTLKSTQTAYEAALSASASIMDLSLVDYL